MPEFAQYVVLSSPILLTDGLFYRSEVTLEQAKEWVERRRPKVYSSHPTVQLLGLEPATVRETCVGYEEALVVQPLQRLDFGREYSLEELGKIGVQYVLIERVRR